jgi:plastocyanin
MSDTNRAIATRSCRGQRIEKQEERNSSMWRYAAISGVVVLGCAVASCGGYTSAPDPVASPPPPGNAVVINVVGIAGAQSFSPNPSTVPPGQLVVWHNGDTIVHRIVLNDGELDTGNIVAGASSAAMALVAPGPYHCSIHPEMVGTFKAP